MRPAIILLLVLLGGAPLRAQPVPNPVVRATIPATLISGGGPEVTLASVTLTVPYATDSVSITAAPTGYMEAPTSGVNQLTLRLYRDGVYLQGYVTQFNRHGANVELPLALPVSTVDRPDLAGAYTYTLTGQFYGLGYAQTLSSTGSLGTFIAARFAVTP